jgi:SPP1 gp7 family putative phage head morphogenesis protein
MDRKWDSKRFEYSDKKLKELMEKENLIFEKSKFKFKKIAKEQLNKEIQKQKDKKINYKDIKFEQSLFEKQSNVLYFDELNNLTITYLVDVANNSYEFALNELKEIYEDDEKIQKFKAKKIKKKMIELWNTLFILGLRTSYNDDLKMQSQYLAYRISNGLNENMQQEKSKDKILNMNSIPLLLVYKMQKKKYANLIDNIFTNVVNLSQMELYKDLGIEKVIRVAELDDRTCKECEMLDGEIYDINDAPDVIIHDFCRCYYVPYDEEIL